MDRPRDMSGFVRVGYMDEHGRPHELDIAEWSLKWAIDHGWSLVFRYDDDLTGDVDPSQSSRRIGEDDQC